MLLDSHGESRNTMVQSGHFNYVIQNRRIVYMGVLRALLISNMAKIYILKCFQNCSNPYKSGNIYIFE